MRGSREYRTNDLLYVDAGGTHESSTDLPTNTVQPDVTHKLSTCGVLCRVYGIEAFVFVQLKENIVSTIVG